MLAFVSGTMQERLGYKSIPSLALRRALEVLQYKCRGFQKTACHNKMPSILVVPAIKVTISRRAMHHPQGSPKASHISQEYITKKKRKKEEKGKQIHILRKNASKYCAVCKRECKKRGRARMIIESEKEKEKEEGAQDIHMHINPSKREILFSLFSVGKTFSCLNQPHREFDHLTYLALSPAKASGLCRPLPAKPWKSLLSWLTCLVPLVGCGACCCWLNGFMLPLRGIVALRWGACICCCCCATGTLSSGRDCSGR